MSLEIPAFNSAVKFYRSLSSLMILITAINTLYLYLAVASYCYKQSLLDLIKLKHLNHKNVRAVVSREGNFNVN